MEKKHQYQGLTKQEVEESRRLHGENILTPPEKASLWSQFLEKLAPKRGYGANFLRNSMIRLSRFYW